MLLPRVDLYISLVYCATTAA